MKPADVLDELARYARAQPGDAAVLARFRVLLESTSAPFSRVQFSPGHLTCSACVLGDGGQRVLLVHHARLGRWLQPGGHVELGDESPLASARREVEEESGLAALEVVGGARRSISTSTRSRGAATSPVICTTTCAMRSQWAARRPCARARNRRRCAGWR